MKPIYQTITGTIYANCLQAAVASYLEKPLNEVPNFMLFHDKFWEAIKWYFISLGYDIGYVDGMPPIDNRYYIGSIDYSGLDYSHAVIVKNQIIVHNPHPDSIKNDQDKISGYYWIGKR